MESEADLSSYFVAIKEACSKILQRIMFSIKIRFPFHDTDLLMLNADAYSGSRQVVRVHEVEFVDLLSTVHAADRLQRLVSIEPEILREVAVTQIVETREFTAIVPSLISSLGAHCSKSTE